MHTTSTLASAGQVGGTPDINGATILDGSALVPAILDALPVGVWITDQSGQVRLANAAARRILEGAGYVGGDFGVYQGWWSKSGAPIGAADWALARALTRGETSVDEMIDLAYLDGSRRTLLNSAAPLRDAEGAIVGAIMVNQDVTGRRQAERAVAASEARFRAAIDGSLDSVYLFESIRGGDGTIVDFVLSDLNPRAERFLGRPRVELIAQPLSAISPVAMTNGSFAKCVRVVETGEPLEEELAIAVPGVRATWVHRQVVPLGDGIAVSARDISQRMLAKDALRQSEERFRALVQNVTDVILIFDAEGVTQYLSPAVARLIEYRPEDLIGINALSMLHPDDLPLAQEHLKMLLATPGSSTTVELRHRHHDGYYIDIEAVATNLLYDDAVGGIVVNYRDITQRKHAEAEIRRQTSFLQVLQAISSAANAAQAVEPTIALALDAICEQLGWPVGHAYLVSERTAGALVSTDLWHFDQPERFTGLRASSEAHPYAVDVGLPGQVLVTGAPVWSTVTNLTPEIAASPRTAVHIAGGIQTGFAFPVLLGDEVVAVLEFFTTELVARDATLLAVMAQVGIQLGRVVERVRVARAQERSARQLAQSNRELQDFASIASHDLQEPLRKIQAFGGRLQTKEHANLSADGQLYVERMRDAARRMQSLITDLLAYSRVTSKAQRLSPVDLMEVARGVITDLETRMDQTGGQVELSELPTIIAEPLQMRQLFQNLIGNALKFHGAAPPQVRVSARLSQHNGLQCYEIEVADNGIGFEEKYRDRIFAPFQRLQGREAYEGTGMGLAICRRIAERHNGTITARSTPGEGTTFVVTLPISHPDERTHQ